MIGDLLISIGVWLVYFSVLFFPLRWLYDRMLGPRPSDRHADRERLAAWTARQTRLRRVFVAVGIGLALLPLVVRVLVSLSKAVRGA
ncbi:MAG: hypothetical protein ACOYXU_07510 [Nitrospirota bacterium]